MTTTAYLTLYRELIDNEATSISTMLANKAFTHSLTSKDITKATLTKFNDSNSFVYNSTIASRYASNVF
jgi:hypothetical protein